MPQPIKIKRSATPGKVPVVADLQPGELALNTYDGRLYTLINGGVPEVVEIAANSKLAPTRSVEIPFVAGAASPIALALCDSGKLVLNIQVILSVPFSDANATLSIGDSTNQTRFVSSSTIDLTVGATFDYYPNYAYGTQTQVNLYLTSAGSIQGSGVVVVKVQQ